MIVTEETKATAQAVLDYLIMNPEKHDQTAWAGITHDTEDFPTYFWSTHNEATEENLCGTTMCVAGTAVYLSDGIEGLNACGQGAIGGTNATQETWVRRGAELLGLDMVEANVLFFTLDNDKAIDMLVAVANGDEDKFHKLTTGSSDF